MSDEREALIARVATETGLKNKSVVAVLNALAAAAADDLNKTGKFAFPGVGTVVRKEPEKASPAGLIQVGEVTMEPAPAKRSGRIRISPDGSGIIVDSGTGLPPGIGLPAGTGLPPSIAEVYGTGRRRNVGGAVISSLPKKKEI